MRHQSSHSHVDTATNGKLVEECGEIVADRSLADAHPLCDFLVKPAECSVPQHFTLAGESWSIIESRREAAHAEIPS